MVPEKPQINYRGYSQWHNSDKTQHGETGD